MNKLHLYSAMMLFVVSFALPINAMAVPYSYSDLWDVSNGVTINSTSGVLNYNSVWRSDIRDMFGSNYGYPEPGNTIFKDYMSPGLSGGNVQAGYTHFVEWNTSSLVTLRSFALHASNEPSGGNTGMLRRAFSQFRLFTGDGAGNWTTIYDTGPGFTYEGALEIATDITAISAQYFRAEFVQASWNDPRAVGPRIVELDGFSTFLDGSTGNVPEPATLALMGLGLAGVGFRRKKRA